LKTHKPLHSVDIFGKVKALDDRFNNDEASISSLARISRVLDKKEEFSGILQRNSIIVSTVSRKGNIILEPRLARKIEKWLRKRRLGEYVKFCMEFCISKNNVKLIDGRTGSSFAACLSQENGEKWKRRKRHRARNVPIRCGSVWIKI